MNDATRPSEVAAARALFPGAEEGPYMDVARRGLLSRPARAAINQVLDDQVAGILDKDALFETVERSRARFAGLIGAAVDEVAITKNVSEGLNAIAASLDWRPGDNAILCPELEHPNNVYPWLNLARRQGIELRTVPADNNAMPVARMAEAIDERTRAVTASTVTFSPGFRADLAMLGRACRERDVFFLVDGVQSVGTVATDVEALAIDAMAVSTQKGLLGLYGMGFLYCRRAWAERLAPVYLARFGADLGAGAHEAMLGGTDFAYMPGARRFDLGNYNFPATAVAETSLDLLTGLGAEAIEAHVSGLVHQLAGGLLALGLPVCGGEPGPHLAGLVTVGEIGAGHDSADDTALDALSRHLADNGVRHSVRRGVLRFSLHLYNDAGDVARVVALAGNWLSRHNRGP